MRKGVIGGVNGVGTTSIVCVLRYNYSKYILLAFIVL